MTNIRRGTRTFIRESVPCEKPDGCGAVAGEPCVSYTGRRGSTGVPQADVHAARWRAMRAWLSLRQQARSPGRLERGLRVVPGSRHLGHGVVPGAGNRCRG